MPLHLRSFAFVTSRILRRFAGGTYESGCQRSSDRFQTPSAVLLLGQPSHG